MRELLATGPVRTALVSACLLAGLAAGGSSSATAWSADRFKGLSLAEALSKLQRDGLRVVFSSELVRPDMTVSQEPRGRWPHEILDELLVHHGLQAKRGPSGALLIVKGPWAGSIVGAVRRAGSSEALPDVRIVALGTDVKAFSAADGSFNAGPLPEGTYVIEVSCKGFLPRRLEGVPVTGGAPTRIQLELDPQLVLVEEVVVRSGDPASRRGQPVVRESMGPERLLESPEVGHDPLLLVGRAPGVAVTDGSGEVNVRGGAGREVKIVLDGLELYEPYHLKDRGSPISIIDSRNIGEIGLLGGAFPAEYGGHMSAVVEMDTILPSAERESAVSVSSGDARLSSQGVLEDRLQWLVSARRGDPAQFLDALGADPSYEPHYWDLHGKVSYRSSDKTVLTFNTLGGEDVMAGDETATVETVEEPGTFRSQHSNRYFWLSLERGWTPRLFSQTVLSAGQFSSDRFGSSLGVLAVADSRSTALMGLKQDWLLSSGRHLFKWGLDAKRMRADYHYTSTPAVDSLLPIAISRTPQGMDLGLYAGDRLRLTGKLSLELGLRWDVQTYTPHADRALSPRVNGVYAASERTTLRLGWGFFYQPQRIHELQVEDGVDQFSVAELAEHRLVSVEHQLDRGLLLQLNAYQKQMSNLRPRFENLFDPFGFFPEADGDRVRIAPAAARAEGLELMVRKPVAAKTGWWAAYALSRAEDEIDGAWVPRSWDQRHALSAGLLWKAGARWDFTLAGRYHSGRPTTPVTAEARQLADGSAVIDLVSGARNSQRLPAYQRIDLRVGRSIPLHRTDLKATMTVTNAFDRENACCVAAFDIIPSSDGKILARPRMRHGLPRLVTLGLSWSF